MKALMSRSAKARPAPAIIFFSIDHFIWALGLLSGQSEPLQLEAVCTALLIRVPMASHYSTATSYEQAAFDDKILAAWPLNNGSGLARLPAQRFTSTTATLLTPLQAR